MTDNQEAYEEMSKELYRGIMQLCAQISKKEAIPIGDRLTIIALAFAHFFGATGALGDSLFDIVTKTYNRLKEKRD